MTLPRLSAPQTVRKSLHPDIEFERGRVWFMRLEEKEAMDRFALDIKPATPETNDAG